MVLHMRAEHAPLNPASICVHAADHLARRTQTWRHPAGQRGPARMGTRVDDSDQEDDSDGHPGG
jgi:hypothetical protein